MKSKKLILSTLLLSTGLVMSSTAIAGSTSATFNVTMQILATCSISAQNINFGTHYSSETTDLTQNGQVSVECPTAQAYSVALSPSQTVGLGDGKLSAGGSDRVNYTLYRADTYAVADVWGTANTYLYTGTGNGSAQPITVYAKILGAQLNVAEGNYVDTVTATLTY